MSELNFHKISPFQLQENPFYLMARDWALLSAKDKNGANTMTIGWGSLGVMWSKNVVFAFVRPQRYTKEKLDAADSFTLSFFDESWRKKLSYCGSVSGRDEDKIARCGFKEFDVSGAPCFLQARLNIVCKKLYVQQMTSESFTEKELDTMHYPDKDYHWMYIGEIETILEHD